MALLRRSGGHLIFVYKADEGYAIAHCLEELHGTDVIMAVASGPHLQAGGAQRQYRTNSGIKL